MNKEINKEWLESPFPQDSCPYCGESNDVNYEREEEGTEVIYRCTCGRCGKTWGQAFNLVFDCNFEN